MPISRRTISWGSLLALILAACSGSNDVEVGSLEVSVTTTGTNPDADGYTITVGQRSAEPIAADGDLTVTELLPGDYPVRLAGVANNCFVVGTNPITGRVTAGGRATAAFEVSCPGSGGRVKVTMVTTGADLDTDGYTLKIGAPVFHVTSQGVNNITVDAEGPQPLELSGLKANCTADPTNPTTVTVSLSTETALTLKVDCAAITGSVKVTVASGGADVQQKAFGVTVGGTSKLIDAATPSTFIGVAPGPQTVTLDQYSLNANCQAQGGTSRSVNVTVGATTEVTFTVVCVALAHINMSVTTLGLDPDTDGYHLQLVFEDYYASVVYELDVASNGTTQGPPLQPGTYYNYVTGVAANCIVESATPRPVILFSTDQTLYITVQCQRAHQLAFVAGAGSSTEIWLGSETGTRSILTTNTAADSNPAWSPDGARLAFTSTRDGNNEIYVMNADGSNVVRLTNSVAADYQPTWSSDGTRIAFVSQRDGNNEIYVMNADGSSVVRLTNDPASDLEPAWSPAGNRILFVSNRAGSAGSIYVMNADGTGVTRLTNQPFADRSPAWSVSGGQVAFMRDNGFTATLGVMNSDGSGQTDQFLSSTLSTSISWAPNTKVALTLPSACDNVFPCSGYSVSVRQSDGSVARLPWSDSSEPAWRP